VAYQVGGIPEWLTHNVTGRLIPVGDVVSMAHAIEEVASDPELVRRMGDAGARDAAKWIASDHGVQLRSVYADALTAWPKESFPRRPAVTGGVGLS
jgi:glycosyltransferase involved in cell wall biosynthesis